MSGGHETVQGLPFSTEPQASDIPTPSKLEFQRVESSKVTRIVTPINLEHIQMIGDWEMSVWGINGRPFRDSINQVEQELGEMREVWIKVVEGELSLGDKNVIHETRAEIGDGLIAKIGSLRSLFKGDDIRAAEALHKILIQPTGKEKPPDQRVTLYSLKSQSFIDTARRLKGRNPHNFTKDESNVVLGKLGGAIRAGIIALEGLGIDPGQVVLDKYRIMNLKYAERDGTMAERKADWERKQLRVLEPQGGVIFEKAA